MKSYTVKTRFVFEGAFEVQASHRQEAIRIVEEGCGVVPGGNIHTMYSKTVVSDWNFPVHPEKVIVSVKNRKISGKCNHHLMNRFIKKS